MHATGTRNLERLGGLHRRMPATATLFLLGTLAISTLPPLNGFASEFLLYTSLFTAVATGSTFAVLALAIPLVALALVGGLALTCFVKVYAMTFSGHPRSQEAAEAHESARFILIPMLILAILSLAAGIIPLAPVWLLDSASQAIIPSTSGSTFHFPPLSLLSGVMGGFLALLGILLLVSIVYLLRRRQGEENGTTWDCGYLVPSPRIQYTPSSFSELLIKLLSGIVKPRFHHPVLRGIFPTDTLFTSTVPERELKGVIFPLMSGIRERSARLRALQHGQLHLYILYILATLLILLTWAYL
jgi:hydrogenase-4 component B